METLQLEVEPISDASTTSLEDQLNLPQFHHPDSLGIATVGTKGEAQVNFFRESLGNYLLIEAPFFSAKVVVPLIRDLRDGLKISLKDKIKDFQEGKEVDRGYSRAMLEDYLQYAKSINLAVARTPREKTLKRVFKLLTPVSRSAIKRMRISHVETKIGINEKPSERSTDDILEDYIVKNALQSTGIDKILRKQLRDSSQKNRLTFLT